MSDKPPSSDQSPPARPGPIGLSWMAGGLLVLLGVLFLLQNFGVFRVGFNWWAFFILIPAVGAFVSAWNAYRSDGRFSRRARGSVTGGLFITLVAVILLLGLDWGRVWPLFLIIAGVGAVLTRTGN